LFVACGTEGQRVVVVAPDGQLTVTSPDGGSWERGEVAVGEDALSGTSTSTAPEPVPIPLPVPHHRPLLSATETPLGVVPSLLTM